MSTPNRSLWPIAVLVAVTTFLGAAWWVLLVVVSGLGTCGEDSDPYTGQYVDRCTDGWGVTEQATVAMGGAGLVWLGLATYAIRKRSRGALLGGISIVLVAAIAGFALVA